ncbi:hypothetical protein [Amycolatopsis sp. FDAARGOS 1241]|uniref:hypothetical protein n=1 Tax=Amycolatopsis sp. FDAARGOS 1241 TaxID=2778070 RepID=UPI00194E9338|nr:hypothetical protein [Amycolatopsis sp. FDAARGOS 1241]QRP45111.1 hypothetical protein I6J71_38980 [Amycolatopsis sp. FDAARGOS 1241]
MDPRDRADALLARARSRGAFVVTPDNMTSPMDASNTQQIPRAVVKELDQQDPDTTTQLPASLIEENDEHPLAKQTSTQPLATPAPQVTTPLVPRPQAAPVASPLKEQADEELTGLVPTIKQNSGRSNLSRRLDGL